MSIIQIFKLTHIRLIANMLLKNANLAIVVLLDEKC